MCFADTSMLACFWLDGNRLMCVKSSYLQINAFEFRDASEKHPEYLNKRGLMLCVHVFFPSRLSLWAWYSTGSSCGKCPAGLFRTNISHRSIGRSDRQSEQAERPMLMWPRWWWWRWRRAVTGADEEERCTLIKSPSTWITMTSLHRSTDLCTANKPNEHECVWIFPSVFLHQYEKSIQTGRETHTQRLRQQFSAYWGEQYQSMQGSRLQLKRSFATKNINLQIHFLLRSPLVTM